MENGHSQEIALTTDQAPVVIPATALESLTRAETDIQISTAKRYPRALSQFKALALAMATNDMETAASCFYALPRDGKTIEGPSVRLAEIVVSAWGNIRAAARIVSEDENTVVAQGICHDLQTNVAISVEVARSIKGRNGRRFSPDMVNVTKNAACAIAFRNAVFKVIPKAFVDPVYLSAKKAAVGDEKTLNVRKAAALAHFEQLGVPKARVLTKLERAGVEDITLQDMELLHGLATALKDGDTTVDEAFPVAQAVAPTTEGTAAEKLAATILPKDIGREPKTLPED